MTERRLLRVTGPEREDFLQGLVTNDVRRAPVYAALLTPQGKYLADFFIIPDGDGFLLDVAADQADDLKRRLTMYKLRAKVAIEDDPRQVSRGLGPAPEGAIADPRDPALGWRGYGVGENDSTDWDAVRVAHLVPQAGLELGPDSYILEMGFERLNGVDFRKGCYVGQEVTARMKHKTELKKGLRRVLLEGEVPPGTPILMGDGREAGTVYTQAGGQGVAYLRFDRIGEGMTADGIPVRVE
ncbi:folate-binding protein YgfZ [Paracoccus sp. SCSIO 75233]|uniref:CAF17-like 4Fe-4S cluster assembly/insertion protein YgfZ n=1 Tax=Paracoccus sp. SCSIO 75233 TaxID=3017782 RepID=UPI0022F05393|nr:folate-binding protein [Paracoccus sp. SCSIO 75233]WBU52234.1 folate-binding protein [Paracoccus sp. SCSIO 75233]